MAMKTATMKRRRWRRDDEDEDGGEDAVIGSSNGPGYYGCGNGRLRKRRLHGYTTATPRAGVHMVGAVD